MPIDLLKYEKSLEGWTPEYLGIHLTFEELQELVLALQEAKEIIEDREYKFTQDQQYKKLQEWHNKYFPKDPK